MGRPVKVRIKGQIQQIEKYALFRMVLNKTHCYNYFRTKSYNHDASLLFKVYWRPTTPNPSKYRLSHNQNHGYYYLASLNRLIGNSTTRLLRPRTRSLFLGSNDQFRNTWWRSRCELYLFSANELIASFRCY